MDAVRAADTSRIRLPVIFYLRFFSAIPPRFLQRRMRSPPFLFLTSTATILTPREFAVDAVWASWKRCTRFVLFTAFSVID
ncbi:hypothetical protein MRX96_044020 [Rhipicephalus microplus]